MMILALFTFPFFLQTLVILCDEFFFHIKRPLPRWERIGHPLDTLSVLICFLYVLFFPFNSFHLKIYIGLALFSCLFVTKDEFVHKECCPAAEQWLHALLFINHPIILSLLGILWPVYKNALPTFLVSLQAHHALIGLFLWTQVIFIGLFALYQTLYWNLFYKEKRHDQQ